MLLHSVTKVFQGIKFQCNNVRLCNKLTVWGGGGGETGEEFSFTENLQSIKPRSNKYQPNVIKKQFDTMLRQVNA